MTTILVNDNKMYGDGQMTGQHISSYKTKKIVNFGTAIVGGAGRWASVVKFHQWVYENLVAQVAQEDHPFANIMMPEDMVEDDFMGLVLYPDGTVIMFEGCKNSFEHEQPVAIGSGADFAIACAHNGLDGKVAIETASYFDTGTGGEIQVEDFDNEEDEPLYSKEDFEDKSKEEILAMLFGEDEAPNVETVKAMNSNENLEYETIEDLMEDCGVEYEEDNFKCKHFEQGIYELKVYSNGKLDCCDYEPLFTSFVETQNEFGSPELKCYADLLGVKFPHNIGQNTLAQKLDEKVKEIVDSLNQ